MLVSSVASVSVSCPCGHCYLLTLVPVHVLNISYEANQTCFKEKITLKSIHARQNKDLRGSFRFKIGKMEKSSIKSEDLGKMQTRKAF